MRVAGGWCITKRGFAVCNFLSAYCTCCSFKTLRLVIFPAKQPPASKMRTFKLAMELIHTKKIGSTAPTSDKKCPDFCPRLIDYLVICGIRHPGQRRAGSSSSEYYHNLSIDVPEPVSAANATQGASVPLHIVQNPDLLRRYPSDDHKDFKLPSDVVFFCQPEGCISVESRRQTFRDASSFVFTLTEKDSAKIRFGICVNFYRTYEKRPQNQKLTTSGDTVDDSGDVRKTFKTNHLRLKRTKRYYTLTSLCIISHHPFFTTFRQTLNILRKLIDACNVRAFSAKPTTGVNGSGNLKHLGGMVPNPLPTDLLNGIPEQRDLVWAALTGQMKENIPGVVMHEIRELETWILKLLSAPVPVPGKTRVELQILPAEFCDPLLFGLPDHTRFSLVDFPLHLPLELLNIDSVIKVLTCIMLEYKVVLQSRDFNAVSMCVLSLVSLLYPLEYLFPVIPLLPNYLPGAENLFLAPTPFVIGVPASFFNHKKMDQMPSDIVIVDLDSDRVSLPSGTPFPEIPEPEYRMLKNHFQQALTTMNNQTTRNLDINRKLSNNGIIADVNFNDTDAADVATRIAMVKFFNAPNILMNFTEHTRTLRLYPRPVVALQTDSFLRSRPIKSEFTRQLARTQGLRQLGERQLGERQMG
uniref:MAP kinase-activating death domain protein n=1 Tax=Romanomermis culicivorax TaxID=13658 RepID=A0A915K3N1_ROMCU